MPGNLTTPFTIGNGARLIFATPDNPFIFNDESQELQYTLELRTTVAQGDIVICSVQCVVRNGLSTQVARQASPAAGLSIGDWRRYFVVSRRSTPTGYTAAKTAERAAADTQVGRRAAMEAHLLSAGHIDATLAYT